MPTRAFNEFLYEFLYEFLRFFNFGKFVKIREFFAEVTNSRSMNSRKKRRYHYATPPPK